MTTNVQFTDISGEWQCSIINVLMRYLMIANLIESLKNSDLSETSNLENGLAEMSVHHFHSGVSEAIRLTETVFHLIRMLFMEFS